VLLKDQTQRGPIRIEEPPAVNNRCVTGCVTGRVTAADPGTPLAQVVMTLTRSSGGRNEGFLIRTDSDGVFVFEDLGFWEYGLIAVEVRVIPTGR
jgi:hypothetical protein